MGNLTRRSAWGEDLTPPLLLEMVLGTRCHAWVLSSPPQGLLYGGG